ncbi:hypothetical protein APHAL10511_006609 [Amanita phalloides]|nr:hypothetical protein APHAL10511_006609 [Amanita phalloides]
MIIREEPPGVPNHRPISSNGIGPTGVWNSSISFTTAMVTTHTHTHTNTNISNRNVGTDMSMRLPLSVPPSLSVPPPLSLVGRQPPLSPTPSLSLARPAISPTGPRPLSSRPLSLARPSPLSPTRPLSLSLTRPQLLSPPPLSATLPPPVTLVRPAPLSPSRPLSLARPAPLSPAPLSPTRPLSLTRPRALSPSPLFPTLPPPLTLVRPAPLSPIQPLSLARPAPLSPTRPLSPRLSPARPSPLSSRLSPARPPSLSLTRPRPLSLIRPLPLRSRRPPLARPPPYTERARNAHIDNSSFPSSSIGSDRHWNEIGTSARASEEPRYREQGNVIDLTTSVAPPPPPQLDNGWHVPDTLNGTYDRDFLYAVKLQMEEYQGHEDGQMPMMDVVDLPTSAPRYNLHPRSHGTGMMSNVVAGPSSQPLTTSTVTGTAIATGTTTTLLTCECIGCFDSFKSFEGLQSSCGHYFCLPCVRTMVMSSVSDESLFPPKCCKQPLMATFAEQMARGGASLVESKNKDKDKEFMQIKWLGLILDDSELKEKMEKRWHEWGVKGDERVYCSNASCAVFLGSVTEFGAGERHPASANTTRNGNNSQTNLRLFHGKKSSSSSMDAGSLPIARCAACATSTCVSCRGRAHTGQTCTDNKDVAFWNMVKVKRWRQCPECGAVIEKNGGCSHMACRCGNSFTYKV